MGVSRERRWEGRGNTYIPAPGADDAIARALLPEAPEADEILDDGDGAEQGGAYTEDWGQVSKLPRGGGEGSAPALGDSEVPYHRPK